MKHTMDTEKKSTHEGTDETMIRRLYRDRYNSFTADYKRLSRHYSTLANIRLILFLMIVLSLGKGIFGGLELSIPWIGAAGVMGTLFVILIVYHRRLAFQRDRAETLARINREAYARCNREWNEFELPFCDTMPADQPLANDLDLFGFASLFHLLGTVVTPPGRTQLSRWLITSVSPEVIKDRQAAVQALTPALEFRQEFQFLGAALASRSPDVEPFVSWSEKEPWLLNKPWLIRSARILTFALIGGVVLGSTGILPPTFWILILPFNALLTGLYRKKVHDIFTAVNRVERDFFHYGNLFDLCREMPKGSPLLGNIERRFTAHGLHAARYMRRLHRIIAMADLRYSPMMYGIVQLFTLWDFHVLSSLEHWRSDTRSSTRGWFEAIGDLESLLTLAGLAHDHPDWTFPTVQIMTSPAVTARDLGHPLLPPRSCIRNDVVIGPPGTFLLVTGSNMSGKSTLLRAIGVNATLAMAGGPVCATEMTLPTCIIGTSFRIQDSLTSGVSFFLAEVKRIKQIIDLTTSPDSHDRPLLYLFDEILLGTNIVERQIAIRHILHHLSQQSAIGCIATHDLSIAEAEELIKNVIPVHFRETFRTDNSGKTIMEFDYRLQSGIAPTTNALKLLQLVGLMITDKS